MEKPASMALHSILERSVTDADGHDEVKIVDGTSVPSEGERA
jgi:hypothetical protein